MFPVGTIVKGPQFPETVEIKKCDKIDDTFYIIEAIGRETNQFFELMLETQEFEQLEKINQEEEPISLSPSEIQHFLQYYAIKNEYQYAQSRALGSKNLIPLPHQIQAVYGRMLQSPRVKFLLADDPGAGKTIMSGMLIKELKARLSTERILILVPPLVLKQWQEELDEKFGEHFHIINRATIKEYGGKNPFVSNNLCLASMYWAARDEVKSLINEADFDLIIVDEAHKMAAYTFGVHKKKTKRTRLYQLGELLLHKAEHTILLTATPHKGDVENFRHLMRLLDDDIFSSISANESLKEKSNPFIIRRLKESMTNFDGTPLFPKRTTKTIKYNLSSKELDLYNSVTEYVREHFNRAMSSGSNSTAFAMMLLQRRLSSSIEAIHLSLKRRKKRLEPLLERTLKERKSYLNKLKKLDLTYYNEESSDVQEEIEKRLLYSIDEIDPDELTKEIEELSKLIEKTTHIKLNVVERKYKELEETLFGLDGFLNQGEKILIFTESKDTLTFLEKQLLKRVPAIAKIIGDFSMDERRRQVELFRNETQIMLATDAGGESINLQFCNQMINYDIPWNPNRLEQRMGRIHRIGQKNEVFVFNLVAQNTREGDVMIRLIEKLERMREDLGTDLVYDFIGDVLEDNYDNLASIMQEAIINREKLDEIIANMDKTLSEEHEKLIKMVREERLDDESIDLPDLKREQSNIAIQSIPNRIYSDYVEHILTKRKVRVYKSNDGFVKRIERFPKFIRDFALTQNLNIDVGDSIRFTGFNEYEGNEVELLNVDSSIVKLSMVLTQKELDKISLERYMVSYPISETLSVEGYIMGITDGTGQMLKRELVFFAKREDGTTLQFDPYWLFQSNFSGEGIKLNETNNTTLKSEALKRSITTRDEVRNKREYQLDKMRKFLENTFKAQYEETLKKLEKYQNENVDNKNSALINQMNANLIDIENKKEERLNLIDRQVNIGMKPPKRVIQLELTPNGRSSRLISTDYNEIVEKYERDNGRRNVKMMVPLALVDFYSERFNGEERYIILTNQSDYFPTEEYLEDLRDILSKVYIYTINNGVIVDERAMADEVITIN
ncbi:superfamily II DNA or RNA helicase [Salirhabdus euzebyi]|uniref:Superfamily II DNA or RNA helicase n=1 Tax=Salirhabdus euzebyi TaxID=394506 RepID=A0A841PXV6_9BACI|nr:helicase-related protein [Salirhabdus euzebyi]MBB6451621.1 superfamily II DNA or RNA helicase [Salirhabdus euzebyi]